MKTGPGMRIRFRFLSQAALGVALWAGPERLAAAAAPCFYFGSDLSYGNEMEDGGAVYRENGRARDPYEFFAAHGTNLGRVRRWNDPWWQPLLPQSAPGVKPPSSDRDDVIGTIIRARAAGMQVLRDFQFSDLGADPGRQIVPRAWSALMNDDAALAAAVHDDGVAVLTTLNEQGLMPELVAGNDKWEDHPDLVAS